MLVFTFYKEMQKCQTSTSSFAAMADPTRRAILARLARGARRPLPNSRRPLRWTQPAVSQHLKVLERAGLIARRIDGQRRPCRLAPDALTGIEDFLTGLRARPRRQLRPPRHPSRHPSEKGASEWTTLTVDLSGETSIIVRRRFRHPPERIFRAHTDPALIPLWMTGPDDYTMPRCDCDARPGGTFRFEWTNGAHGFHATGEFHRSHAHARGSSCRTHVPARPEP